MPIWTLMFAVVGFCIVVLTSVTTQQSVASTRGEAQAIAGNMCVVRNALMKYQETYPGATGPISTAALTLPTWFVPLGEVSAYVGVGGHPLVFVSRSSPELIFELRTCGHLVQGEVPVGIARSSKLVDAKSGITVLDPLPTAIQEGSVVLGKL